LLLQNGDQELTSRRKIAGWSLLGAWLALRLLLIPADPATTGEFSHDSAYLSIVARNLETTHRYINDAHWLLFLHPPELPMPYHNANPLYPTLSAMVSTITGVDPATAGALVSAASSALLALAVFSLALRFSKDFWFSMLAAAAAVLWPGNFRESFTILPDALSTSLAASAFAVAAHAHRSRTWFLCGVLLGLSWLTRSSALLVLPGIVVWMFLQDRTRWPRHLTWMLAASVLTVSPWLVRNAQVRGSPFASDESYYWLQEYHAQQSHRTVDQYWRSLDPPPTFGQILRTEAPDFAVFLVKSVPRFVRLFAGAFSDWSHIAAAAILAAIGLAAALLPWRAVVSSPIFVAGALTVALSTAALIPRPETTEVRYWSVSNLFLLMALLAPFAWRTQRLWGRVALAACLLVFAAIEDVNTVRSRLTPGSGPSAYRERALAALPYLDTKDPVIAFDPYLFTYFTGRPAISPPYPAKTELLKIMQQYGARFVLLSNDQLDYLYPGAPQSLAPELQVQAELKGAILLKRS
jgi:hypothetical protein